MKNASLNAPQIWNLVEQIQSNTPIIHCITNTITINDCANILLAIHAAPTMAHHPLEVEEITSGCQSLVCNLGAMDDFEAMKIAVKAASKLNHPIVVDPVGAGASKFRRDRFFELLQTAPVTCVRGNYSEIKALLLDSRTTVGVDAAPADLQSSELETAKMAAKLAKLIHCTVIVSGAVDLVSDGNQAYAVYNGDARMSRITGSGCMSSVLLGAFLSQSEFSLEAAAASCSIMGICGELAAAECEKRNGGTMTFRMLLIDALSTLKKEEVYQHAKVKKLSLNH